MSHELRTPLTAVRGSLGLMLAGAMGEIGAEQADVLRIAASSVERLVDLMNRELRRLEAGLAHPPTAGSSPPPSEGPSGGASSAP